MSSRPRRVVACIRALVGLSVFAVLLLPRSARAEKVLLKDGPWEVYTEGRVGAFASYVFGDGAPVPTQMITLPDGTVKPETMTYAGWALNTDKGSETEQGHVHVMRVRSGFIGNVLGFGVRNQIYPELKATGFVQIWSYIESENRNKGFANPADLRQGYAKLEGPTWGSLIAGRTRTLFSRGATDINVMYAHRWGVGFPNQIESKGPTQGMVGFGVLGSGFAAGFIYGSPVLAGFQLNVGLFDPANIGATGFNRTQFARPEGELTYEHAFGTVGKVVLFANGAYQKIFKPGPCTASPTAGPCDETVEGFGYGGRV